MDKLIKEHLSMALEDLFSYKLSAEDVSLQPTRKEFEGTHTFVTFPFLKISRRSPEQTGQALGEYLQERFDIYKSFNIVKGFLNLEVRDLIWVQTLDHIVASEGFGRGTTKKRKVMVEFSSPNTNKPLHLGHLRNNFLGDSVARILRHAGYDVKKTNLVNDRGIHICKSMLAYQRFGEGETPEDADLKGDHLVGKYYVIFDKAYKAEIQQLISSGASEEVAKKTAPILLEAQSMLKRWEDKDPDVVALWEKMNGWVYEGFATTYATMGIAFDAIYKESDTYLLGKDIIEEGLEKGVFYKKDNGSVWIDLTDEGMDEKLVLRADGTSVYMTQDIGTCDYKYDDFPMDDSVYVVGNEQDYHFKVLFSIMKRLGRSYSEGLHHLSYGMVDLPGGKMKSREGTVVDADDLMQEMFDTAAQHTRELGKIDTLSQEEALVLYKTIGLGALKYFLLKVDPKKRMLFDPKESIEFQGHTGPFVQYTHARIAAIKRRAEQYDLGGDFRAVTELHKKELGLIQNISKYPEVVEFAAKEYSPSIVAQYVYDLAKEYNGFYQEVPILNEKDKDLVNLRVNLSSVTAEVIKSAMDLLGIDVPERM
ncbi:MAG: arginine--tRNA ligase [Cyclobacteriaceae bacterium]